MTPSTRLTSDAYNGEGPSKEVTHNKRPSAPPTIRILILETDHPHPEVHEKKGSYAEILERHFEQAGNDHDSPLKVNIDMRFVVVDKGGKVPTIQEVESFGPHGLLITGSMYDAHDDQEWIQDLLKLLGDLWDSNPKLHFSGVCFGHQLLCRLLGSDVEPTSSGNWELGHTKISLTPIGQALFRTKNKEVHLHQMHQDQVVSPPSPSRSRFLCRSLSSAADADTDENKVHVWGRSEHTPVQGIYIRNRVFTTQAHLAFDEEMVKRELQMRVEKGVLNEDGEHKDQVSRAKETAHLEHDGKEVAAALLRFWAYDDDGIE